MFDIMNRLLAKMQYNKGFVFFSWLWVITYLLDVSYSFCAYSPSKALLYVPWFLLVCLSQAEPTSDERYIDLIGIFLVYDSAYIVVLYLFVQ